MKNFRNKILYKEATIRDALIRLNELGVELTLFVVDKNDKLIGSVTDGDIRRAIINNADINQSVNLCANTKCYNLNKDNITIDQIKSIKERGISIVPLLDDSRKIIDIVNISDTFSVLPLDAIIMAGGRGKRLVPYTDKKPKPLLEVGGVPIIERNIDRLVNFGIDNITIAVKYLGDQIKHYFKKGENKQINISYVTEEEPLGTIGAVKLVNDYKHDDLLIMNSDLLTNIDFEEMFEMYKQSDADMVIASIPYNVDVPYAVLESENGHISSFREKPTYTYQSNAGIYMIKKEVIDIIPENKFYDATDLIDDLIKNGKKVINFPILGYWLDIGKHEDYKKAQKDVSRIKF